MANKNSSHITFSWDIVDDYYTSSYISYFYLYYQNRTSTYSQYISYSSTTPSGTTFSYTSPLETFNNGPYIMWVEVYRPYRYPRYIYSEKTYIRIGKLYLETPSSQIEVHWLF